MKKLLITALFLTLNLQLLLSITPCECVSYTSETGRLTYGWNVGENENRCRSTPGPMGSFTEEEWNQELQIWVVKEGYPIEGSAAQAAAQGNPNCCPLG